MEINKKENDLIHDVESLSSSIESIAGAILIEAGEKKKYSSYVDARILRDKLTNVVCSNADDIKNIIKKNCDLDTQIAVLNTCIELLQNIRYIQALSFQVGFMCGSTLGDDTTDKE